MKNSVISPVFFKIRLIAELLSEFLGNTEGTQAFLISHISRVKISQH